MISFSSSALIYDSTLLLTPPLSSKPSSHYTYILYLHINFSSYLCTERNKSVTLFTKITYLPMKEIRCPHCQKVFSVDESEYAELLSQVKNDSFNEELNRRMAELQKTQEAERKAALTELERSNDKEKAEKDAMIESLKLKLAEVERSITTQVDLAVAQKVQELTMAHTAKEQQLQSEISQKTNAISELNAKLQQNNSEKQIAVMEAKQAASEQLQKVKDEANLTLREKENEITQLKNEAVLNEQKSKTEALAMRTQYEARINQSEEQHKRELEMKDEVIAQYKDFKARLSTKGIGESLEVYCNNQFETLVRPYLPSAVFGKDNAVVEGTKGDFVFRDYVDGTESVSIMFEMKNEAEETQDKKKNVAHFKKLDADRKKKNCEYAVLVSLLELDNDLYNNGIYSVPDYEKMYVVRPQQFLTIISLLVQMGRNTVQVKKELADAKNREIDVTHFEEKLDSFKSKFGKHVKDAAGRYNDALEDIDKAIKQLQTMKENLRLWVDHLYKAENNFDDITIHRLTYRNPTMKALLDEAREIHTAEEVKD